MYKVDLVCREIVVQRKHVVNTHDDERIVLGTLLLGELAVTVGIDTVLVKEYHLVRRIKNRMRILSQCLAPCGRNYFSGIQVVAEFSSTDGCSNLVTGIGIVGSSHSTDILVSGPAPVEVGTCCLATETALLTMGGINLQVTACPAVIDIGQMQLTAQNTSTHAIGMCISDGSVLDTQVTDCSTRATAAESGLPAVVHRYLQVADNVTLSVELATEYT